MLLFLKRVFSAIFLISMLMTTVYAEVKTVKIGVLAHRGEDVARTMWQPTMEYLTQTIPEYNFELVPLDFKKLYRAVGAKQVDFVVVNTGQYIELEASYGISRIATLTNRGPEGCLCNRFGGVFLTKAASPINTLSDMKGKTLLSVDNSSFGGWLMQLREMKAVGIDPESDMQVKTLGDHEKVVLGVLHGEGDVGVIRSDILERMASEGKINLSDIKVINKQVTTGKFPYQYSTRLYPEWPFSKLSDTDDHLAQLVAVALLEMPENSEAAKAAKIRGWSVPADYNPVHELYRELKIGPYKDLGKFNLIDVLKKYWIVLVLALAFMVHLLGSLRHARKQQQELQKEKAALDEAHAKLDHANSLVMESIGYARKIQEASLPDKHALDGAIADIFVCWEPLHVVGGDYFWIEKIGKQCFIVVIDCTGHGVPGAFMTMVASAALHRAIHDLKISDPSELLVAIDERVRTKLRQDYPESTSDDGLDCAICVYDMESRMLTYAGANLPLIYVENGTLNELKPTRASLGYRSIRPKKPFENYTICVTEGMSFYMLTDGISDHMGGSPRRLLGRKRLGDIILQNQKLSMNEQMKHIEAQLEAYRGDEPRRDDMTLIGFRPI
ncbi:PhnD/SsuA/transferrin family substrate-binding protein [Sulfuricurvum sp.]|uniref:PhnD/SsuA/transferrin family substrate-binding protein n=1 Tax=Sulfuricurvum sp. TaxID=2025608 RepID=UPI002E34F65C|nr:PhnD/SsuA/transferrin family substrate-binding protein [Sulfuricurvum sp.]HEX5330504.1 PhnD/SsuA/transferrin family substrate-binding protein [Sulfuricurvum sp.]